MKKFIWFLCGIVFVTGTVWTALAVWRARSNLVSLHVRNATVAEVIASLQRQSREVIVADTNLTALITLDFTRVPLTEALNRVGKQAGALAGIFHAVHKSEFSLTQLQNCLRAGKPVEAVGWRTLAPRLDGLMPLPLPAQQRHTPEGGVPPGAKVRIITEDVQMIGPDGQKPEPGSAGASGPESGQAPVMIMRFGRTDSAGNTQLEVWTPERIVAPSEVAERLPKDQRMPPTRSAARAFASENKAQCLTLYALKQAPGGMGVDTLMARPPDGALSGGEPPGGKPHAAPDDVEAKIRREKLSQYQDLTPEQRVQRTRERQDEFQQK